MSKELSVANRFDLAKEKIAVPEMKKTEITDEKQQQTVNRPQSKEDMMAQMRANSKAMFDDDDDI